MDEEIYSKYSDNDFKSFLSLLLNKKKLFLIIVFISSILSILNFKFQRKLYEVSTEITVNYHPVESFLNCGLNKSNYDCLNQNTIEKLLLLIEEEILKKGKFKVLEIDYYDSKFIEDFKSFNKILNNSKFSLALSTYKPLNKLTYNEKFEFLQNKFESETISEAKKEIGFFEDDEEKNLNNIKSYLKDNPVDHLSIPVTNQSDNNFRREINRILYKYEKGIKPIVFSDISVKNKNLPFILNLLYFNFGGLVLFAAIVMQQTKEKEDS